MGVDSGAGVERGVRWDPQLVNYQEQPSTGEKEESHVKVTSKRPPLVSHGSSLRIYKLYTIIIAIFWTSH